MSRNRGRIKRTKSVKNGILLALALVFIIAIIGSTYSRYMSSGQVNTTGEIAKWNIKLNGNNLSATQNVVVNARAVEGVSNQNVSGNKLAPGRTLVADLEVNPEGTEVAVDYVLTIGEITTQGFNTNSSILVSKVMATLDDEEAVEIALVDGQYAYYESLEDVLAGKKVTFSAHVLWDDVNNAADTANGAGAVTSVQVPIEITAKQHLAGDGNATFVTKSMTVPELESEIAISGTGDKIILDKDYDFGEIYPKSGTPHYVELADNSTLDLGGNTIYVEKFSSTFIGNDITIENGNIEATPDTTYGLFLWDEDTEEGKENVTIKDVSIQGGICVYNVRDIVLENVTVNTNTGNTYYGIYCNTKSTMTVESGTYTVGGNNLALIGYCISDDGETNPVDGFVINGGTFITNGKPLYLKNSTHVAPIVHGGIYDRDITANGEITLEPGYSITQIAENRWEVTAD